MQLISAHLEKWVAPELASVHWTPKVTVKTVGEHSVLNTQK